MSADTRFPWRPDCQEEHTLHEAVPDEPDAEDSDVTCATCGHTLDMVWVHMFEIDLDDLNAASTFEIDLDATMTPDGMERR
jgi:hypothetical protein